MNAAGRGSPR